MRHQLLVGAAVQPVGGAVVPAPEALHHMLRLLELQLIVWEVIAARGVAAGNTFAEGAHCHKAGGGKRRSVLPLLQLLVVADTILAPPQVAAAGNQCLAVKSLLQGASLRAGLGVWIAAAAISLAAVGTMIVAAVLASIDEAAALHQQAKLVVEGEAVDGIQMVAVAAVVAVVVTVAVLVLGKEAKISLLLYFRNDPSLTWKLPLRLRRSLPIPALASNCPRDSVDLCRVSCGLSRQLSPRASLQQ